MPLSLAILRAKGDAFTRLSSSLVAVAAAGAVSAAAGASAGAAVAAAGAAASCNNGVMSVPSLPTIAMMPFTGAALPSSTPMYNKVPAS